MKKNNAFLTLTSVLAILASLWYVLSEFLFFDGMNVFEVIHALLMPLGLFVLLFAFLKHEKNLQKALLGALLDYQLCVSLAVLSFGESFSLFGASSSGAFRVLEVVILVMYGVIMLNHFLLIASHKSRSLIILGSIVALCVLLISFISQMFVTFLGSEATTFEIVNRAVAYLRDFLLMAVLVTVEAKVDVFKQERELEE